MEFILGGLSVLLGILAILFSRDLTKRTDALIQSEDKRVKELLAKMDERSAKMDERGKKQDEILAKMDERSAKMDEDSKRSREEFQRILLEIQKSAERMEQNQRYIADLVKTEAERIIEKAGSV